jgi:hypothetical protein
MEVQPKYGLQITNNSKTGPAFSLSRQNTCINRTSTCTSVCYGRGIRYQSEAQKAKRLQNFETVELLLQLGGSELLAENLCVLIDQVRPIDWLTSRITNCPTALPWTLRIHDVGDFYSVAYVNAWTLAVQSRPECSFWFYTRSFIRDEMCEALSILCALPNCQGWLSVDEDNYNRGLIVFSRFRQLGWKLALLQNDLNSLAISFRR